MKAIILAEHGGIEKLKYIEDYPFPELSPNDVIVKIESAALNHLDLWVLEGWKGIKISYPHVPGADGAGTIEKIGSNVKDFNVGDKVVINANIGDGTCEFCLAGNENLCTNWNLLGETLSGTIREFISINPKNLVKIPDGFDLHAAAASGLVYHTAWHSLITKGQLRPGEKILIVGASGGVNTASIQIAKLTGAEVFVVGSSREKLVLAESLGADHIIDRSENENWSKEVYYMTNKRGVDVVVDNVGVTYPYSMRAVRKGGRILTVGNTGAPVFEFDNRYMFGKHISLIGSTMGTIEDFRTVMNLVFQGKLKSVVDKTFPIAETGNAYQRLLDGKQLGKITIAIQ